MKLNQVIAIAAGTKTKVQKEKSECYQKIQHPELFSGLSRTYRPKDEEGDKLPAEYKKVQLTVGEAVQDISKSFTELWDIVYTNDQGNCVAKADVVIGDKVLAMQVPVSTLLFLEKQLTDLQTFVNKLPILDPSEDWEFSQEKGYYETEPYVTTRTKKIPRNHVKAVATDKHPAQVEVYSEDVIVGEWHSTKFSGAISVTEKRAMLERISKLADAVKIAREEANSTKIERKDIAKPLLDYVFLGQV